MEPAWWWSLVSCPRCQKPLDLTAESPRCSCGYHVAFSDTVPILIDPQKSIFNPAEIALRERTETDRSGLRRLVPSLSLNVAAAANYAELGRLLALTPGPRVLIVGAGEGGVGAETLRQAHAAILMSDVAVGSVTDVCLDAHDIPFMNESFDAVIVQAVLEHVLDPQRVVAEITRVLRLGGLVYAETPFMQQVHMGAYDFTRFTLSGHRRLFRHFEEVRGGTAVGPGSALAWSLSYFVASFAPRGRGRSILMKLATFAFFWIKHFDRFLAHRDAAADAAAGVYFLGRRASEPVSDATVIAGYRGGF